MPTTNDPGPAVPHEGGRVSRVCGGALGAASALAVLTLCGTLRAPAAEAAVLSGVQSGTAVSTGNGTLTVPITAVDPARSFLLFETRHDSGRPVGSMVRGRLASPNTLEFVRVTNETSPISIHWYVAEFSSGVSVQRGEVEQATATVDVSLPTAVAAVDQAFVTWSKTPAANHQNWNGDDPLIGELTGTSTLQFRADTARAGIWISWQVVEFTDPADIRVQKGSTSLAAGVSSVDVTLPAADAVDVDSTFVLAGFITSASGLDVGARMLRAQLIDARTIRFDRGAVGNNDPIEEIHWQAVELRDGSEVLHGSASFATGEAQTLVALGGRTVDPSGAVAFASVQPVGGQNMGASAFTGSDIIGVCSVTMDLAPTFITMDRDNTASTCDVGWFVVQFAPTVATAVELVSLSAAGADGAVELSWETATEIDNLGFHLYRSTTGSGPWERITASLIPGLGSSPEGARYGYRDTGLLNGTEYFYLLEDVEVTGRTERHGPVSATPLPLASEAGEVEPEAPSSDEESPPEASEAWIPYGEPEATSLRVLQRGRRHVVVELRTGGFWALPDEEGGVWLSIPGFEESREPGSPAVPVKRAWLEAVVGRRARIDSVVAHDVVSFDGLRPAVTGAPELWRWRDGTLRHGVRRHRAGRAFRGWGLHPRNTARVLGTAFQGEEKKVQLELAPLRWDRGAGRLLLARRLRVRLVFAGRARGERELGDRRGRAQRGCRRGQTDDVVARLAVETRGLYAASFEDLFGSRRVGVRVSDLSLTHRGEDVPFHVEPGGRWFGPGAVLLFASEGGALNPYGKQAVYELSTGGGGVPMPAVSGAPAGRLVSHYRQRDEIEVNRLYQPTLFSAPDLWLWDYITSGLTKSYTFSVSELASVADTGRLEVRLQGGSDTPADPDHHVRVSVNGQAVAEARWDGKEPNVVEAALDPTLLREGENVLEIANLGDTGASSSLVILDRFEVSYPRALVAQAGMLAGRFPSGGTATVAGVGARSFVLGAAGDSPRWLEGAVVTPSGLSFAVEAGREYLVVAPEALRRPAVRRVHASALRDASNRGEYLLVAPRAMLEAAEPLLEQRRRQGLVSRSVAIEEVYDEFGFGEEGPEALRDFLTHAYHNWQLQPRYVLLLGDATYDFKDHLNTGIANQVPPYMVRDAYMWTVSDPAYASVNGEDLLPDLALGRLPAQDLEQARALVHKVLAWERSGFDLSGRAVLVADNSDRAGDFEGDAERLAGILLSGHQPERIDVSQLGGATRETIVDSFDRGASLYGYLGHGSVFIWASENVFNTTDVTRLSPQAQQPFLFTMDCLNGYFTLPSGANSLSEELLKVEGRGVIGAFSPSSLSLHRSARGYSEALLSEIVSGRHERLGDALLAAQGAYLDSGANPELLATYQLLGDPALVIR